MNQPAPAASQEGSVSTLLPAFVAQTCGLSVSPVIVAGRDDFRSGCAPLHRIGWIAEALLSITPNESVKNAEGVPEISRGLSDPRERYPRSAAKRSAPCEG